MAENKYFEEFGKPFPSSDVKWRLQNINKEKLTGIAVPYLDARAIADRLDAVVGQNRWKDDYREWKGIDDQGKPIYAQLCTIYIYDEDLKEWIGKTDGAENTEHEPVKGGLSDSFKRCAVKWNIGRYLYKFNAENVSVKQWGRTYYITDSGQQKLTEIYNKTVDKLFSNAASDKPKQTDNTKSKTPEEHPVFEVNAVEVRDENSALILSRDGTRYKAYMQGVDNRLQNGTRITNVRIRKGKNQAGAYNIITGYDIAA
ncbi:MAG: Rad52/Rad22 family DNA repair protein [Clostridiales bacterium]|nr:Rad52/Rad22 family DNA repair protein [Clostridiales bacterium]